MQNGLAYDKTKMLCEKMNANSEDISLSENLLILNEFLQLHGLDYLYIGSLSFQCYIGTIYRLPNDFDIVVMNISVEKFATLLEDNNILYQKKLGRIKMFLNDFSIHVLFEYLHQLNIAQTAIFHSLNFKTTFKDIAVKNVIFPCSKIVNTILVPPFEILLFSYLLRPLNSNILQDINMFIDCDIDIDLKYFESCSLSNIEVAPIVRKTLYSYIELKSEETNVSKIEYLVKILDNILMS